MPRVGLSFLTVRRSRPPVREADAVSSLPAGTIEVLESHRFDVSALERFMKRHVDGFAGPLTVRQFRGGQSNPTYYLTTPRQEYVLRRKPPGKLLPSAHAVDREYRVITALAGSGVPVPRTYALCEDPDVVGTPFYVMQYVHGRVLSDPRLPAQSAGDRVAIYDAMTDVLARLHTVDWRAIGLEDFGKPGNYFARQIHRWSSQYRASETERIEAMERLIAWLPEHIPAGDETTLVHGDFRLGNMLVHPTEPRIVAVLDWELSTLGHPLADFSYHVMLWRVGAGEIPGLKGVDLASLGIPTEAEYVAAYCRRTARAPIEPRIWEFCMAYNLFRIACIRQGIMKRVLEGTAASRHAREAGERARETAELAWRQVEERLGG
jgi:aminoglycoside phosphotransferase (APT) family kinase protein